MNKFLRNIILTSVCYIFLCLCTVTFAQCNMEIGSVNVESISRTNKEVIMINTEIIELNRYLPVVLGANNKVQYDSVSINYSVNSRVIIDINTGETKLKTNYTVYNNANLKVKIYPSYRQMIIGIFRSRGWSYTSGKRTSEFSAVFTKNNIIINVRGLFGKGNIPPIITHTQYN